MDSYQYFEYNLMMIEKIDKKKQEEDVTFFFFFGGGGCCCFFFFRSLLQLFSTVFLIVFKERYTTTIYIYNSI